MSEEKRFIENKKILALSISLVIMCALSGVLGVSFIVVVGNYDNLSREHRNLYIDYLELQIDFNSLNETYFNLMGDYNNLLNDFNILNEAYSDITEEYNVLEDDFGILNETYFNLTGEHTELEDNYNDLSDNYDTLEIQYNTLQIAYDYITDNIRQSILPVQYSIFAEAVRRHYMDVYLEGLTGKEYWIGFAEYCRDVILHDSYQYNAFEDVSNAFSDILIYESNTMALAWAIMYYIFWTPERLQEMGISWLPNWGGYGLTGNELTDIDTVVDWCIDEIDYEYDVDITLVQEDFEWDYIKFPVETAFRTFGDCEDQAILTAAYLESCGFETVIAISHDPAHPTYGEFYHGHLLVHIEDTTAFWNLYPTTGLWTIPNDPYLDFTWCWLDTTWYVPFGSTPSWLQGYLDHGGLTTDVITVAFCDIDGAVGENIGMECSIPT